MTTLILPAFNGNQAALSRNPKIASRMDRRAPGSGTRHWQRRSSLQIKYNPPFGIPWNREVKEVEAEYKKGNAGRFAHSLPAKGDGQTLFLLNGVGKLKNDGQMAIIQNGSFLFTGDAGSGQSEIRRYFIDSDWLDAIVQLPANAFYIISNLNAVYKSYSSSCKKA